MVVNKYVGVCNSYEQFLNGIQSKDITIKSNKVNVDKVVVLKGTLAERIVSRELSNEKINLCERVKNLFIYIFSKQYREAKTIIANNIHNFQQRYDSVTNPRAFLYKHYMSQKLQANPYGPKEMENLKKQITKDVNGLSDADAKKFVEGIKSEQVEKAKAAAAQLRVTKPQETAVETIVPVVKIQTQETVKETAKDEKKIEKDEVQVKEPAKKTEESVEGGKEPVKTPEGNAEKVQENCEKPVEKNSGSSVDEKALEKTEEEKPVKKENVTVQPNSPGIFDRLVTYFTPKKEEPKTQCAVSSKTEDALEAEIEEYNKQILELEIYILKQNKFAQMDELKDDKETQQTITDGIENTKTAIEGLQKKMAEAQTELANK